LIVTTRSCPGDKKISFKKFLHKKFRKFKVLMKIYLSIFNISALRLVEKTLEVKCKEKRKEMDDVPMILSPQMKMEL